MSKPRRHYTAVQKAQVVRRHLSDKVPVSDLADELEVQPTQIHLWVKQVLEQAEKAFERAPGQRRDAEDKDRRIAQLQEKLTYKNEVIAELMQEHVALKKELGEL